MDSYDSMRKEFQDSYPQPLIAAIVNSSFGFNDIAEKLGITVNELILKIQSKTGFASEEKGIISKILHIPVKYMIDWFPY